MTLAELAEAARALGLWEAMNLDGGGSATMVVGRRLVNVPSDSVGERTVGNAIVVTRRERRSDCRR
jgi:exopolysaccharide biosynthesis protein